MEHNFIIINDRDDIFIRRRRFTREEVLAAAKKMIQKYIDGDHTVKVYL